MANHEAVIVSERPGGPYTNDVKTSRHHLYADEPTDVGGADLGPTPYEYLCAALGACTSMTLRMYAGRKKWDIGEISVKISHKKIIRGDEKHDVFTREVSVTGDIPEEQMSRLLEIADKCPVHKTLEASSEIVTKAG